MSDVQVNGCLNGLLAGDKPKIPFTLELTDVGTIWFRAEGYGDCGSQDGHGFIVKIEFYEGQLWLLVWADINSEDPTHRISLEGALESKRRAE